MFVATRNDGLGGRVVAILTAISLAQRFDCRFGFTWRPREREFQVVEPVDRVFSAEFISQHWLGEEIDPEDFVTLGDRDFDRASLVRAVRQRFRGWNCDHFDIPNRFRDRWSLRDPFRTPRGLDMAAAFRSLKFSDQVRSAIDAANAVQLPAELAAIHLRSGDIVHGAYRKFRFVPKVIPSALVRSLVEGLQTRGYAVLLVGEDAATLDYLRASTGALTTEEFGVQRVPEGTPREFFEAALMSRCTAIYAGASLFAKLASAISGAPVRDPMELMGRQAALDAVLAELDRHGSEYGPLEAAFGYQWAYHRLEQDAEFETRRRILEIGRSLDPDNEAYDLKLALAHYRAGRTAEGEALLRAIFDRDIASSPKVPTNSMRLAARENYTDKFLSDDLPHLAHAAKQGLPYAALYAAQYYWERGEAKTADAMARNAASVEGAQNFISRMRKRAKNA